VDFTIQGQTEVSDTFSADCKVLSLLCIHFSSGTMKDIKGRWSTLEEKQKDKYKHEAAALRAP